MILGTATVQVHSEDDATLIVTLRNNFTRIIDALREARGERVCESMAHQVARTLLPASTMHGYQTLVITHCPYCGGEVKP